MTNSAEDQAVAATTAGDEVAFAALLEPYRRELHLYCYRMLASLEDADDLVPKILERGAHARSTFTGDPGLRAWLYAIATDACLEHIERSSRQVTTLRSFADVPWLQPYPDWLLDKVAPPRGERAGLGARETTELAYIAVLQLLPPRQRAAVILREVHGWPVGAIATILKATVAACNSALQRGRATLREQLPERPEDWAGGQEPSSLELRLLGIFIEAHEVADPSVAPSVARADVRVTMPAEAWCREGLDTIVALLGDLGPPGQWRLVPTRANRMPAAATYLQAPGEADFKAFKFDVLRFREGRVAELTTFGASLFGPLGLPPTFMMRLRRRL